MFNITKIENLNIMIKPSSSNCNLRCKYCFYFDEAENRQIENFGLMSISTAENLIKNVFDNVRSQVNFLFQGGEPMLVGIDFYKEFNKLVDLYNKNNIDVSFSIQTNGTLIDYEYINHFRKYNYLVGISLDGIKSVHDKNRVDISDNGSFDSVISSIKKLKNAGLDYTVITVINNENVKHVKEIYTYYKEAEFYYMQFIPLIDSIDRKNKKSFELGVEEYGIFLDKLFDFWYKDIKKGRYSSIRYFDNLVLISMANPVETCDMCGNCNIIPTIEADGSCYPCDFYALDSYKLGNVNDKSLISMINSEVSYNFIKRSLIQSDKCRKCKFIKVCRNGCYRYRNGSLNKFCKSYYYFLEKNYKKILEIRDIILQKQVSNSL